MITEDYVSFEVAKLLKEKGFDKDIDSRFSPHFAYNSDGCFSGPSWDTEYNAPTIQMAMKWLRDEKNIHIKVHCSGNRNYLVYAQSLVTAFQDICIESETCSFNTYEEACEAAIRYCLKNLI